MNLPTNIFESNSASSAFVRCFQLAAQRGRAIRMTQQSEVVASSIENTAEADGVENNGNLAVTTTNTNTVKKTSPSS